MDEEAIKEWIKKGAKPSDTIHNLLISKGVIEGKKINVLPKKSPIVKEEEEKVEEVPVAQVEEVSEEKSEAPTEEEVAADSDTEEAPAEEVKEEEAAEVEAQVEEEKKEA